MGYIAVLEGVELCQAVARALGCTPNWVIDDQPAPLYLGRMHRMASYRPDWHIEQAWRLVERLRRGPFGLAALTVEIRLGEGLSEHEESITVCGPDCKPITFDGPPDSIKTLICRAFIMVHKEAIRRRAER